MNRRRQKLTKHHLIPRSRGWNSYYDNICPLKDSIHKALHVIFTNELPHEQIESLVDINGYALSNEFRYDIQDLLSNYAIEEMYNTKCLVDSIILNPNNK